MGGYQPLTASPHVPCFSPRSKPPSLGRCRHPSTADPVRTLSGPFAPVRCPCTALPAFTAHRVRFVATVHLCVPVRTVNVCAPNACPPPIQEPPQPTAADTDCRRQACTSTRRAACPHVTRPCHGTNTSQQSHPSADSRICLVPTPADTCCRVPCACLPHETAHLFEGLQLTSLFGK
ncbi:UNVERIFIED_CONTAM: hypothetical protein Slati_2903100 [Sesamum latifolium]|uniref:Uncharacterized protein n=1 Tax=Sesamum latifolium TaxID=2727402 RepID=A0AAW2VDI0_9LAMI